MGRQECLPHMFQDEEGRQECPPHVVERIQKNYSRKKHKKYNWSADDADKRRCLNRDSKRDEDSKSGFLKENSDRRERQRLAKGGQ